MGVNNKDGYIKAITLRAMTISNEELGNELKVNCTTSIRYKRRLPWALQLPAKVVGAGWRIRTGDDNPKPKEKGLIDAWTMLFMLNIDMHDATLNKLSTGKIRRNINNAVRLGLDAWQPAISYTNTGVVPVDPDRLHVGTILIVKDQVSDDRFGQYEFEYAMRNSRKPPDPANRIYYVMWELYSKFPGYMLKG